MKWGVRRYQNKDGSLTTAGKLRYSQSNRKMKGSGTNKMNYNHDDSGKSKSTFISKQLTNVVYTVMNPANAVFIAKDTVSAVGSKIKEKNALKRQAKSPIDKKTGLHVKPEGSKSSKKADCKSVNPGYADFSDNTKNNCVLCTTAYDLRRRGYDVLAKKASYGYDSNFIQKCYPKAKKVNIDNTVVKSNGKVAVSTKKLKENTKNEILSQGDGARGNICVTWKKTMSGHSMAYEVENGKAKIYDAQSGKIQNIDSVLSKCSSAYIFRLDNVDFDKKMIKEAVR